jgi:hypothetical protein
MAELSSANFSAEAFTDESFALKKARHFGAVARKNSIRSSSSHLLQPVLVAQSTKYSLTLENVS